MAKNKNIIFVLLFSLLSGCNSGETSFSTTSNYESVQDSKSNNELSSSSEISSETIIVDSSSSSQTGEDVTLDFYAINDFHGAIIPANSNQAGLDKLAGFLEEKAENNPGGTIFLDAGDTWQGSADSNITRGKIIIETFNQLDFAAMSIGNHEFDWGPDVLKNNKELLDYPLLGANILKKATNSFANDIADAPSTIIERQGVKIGIIGTIGSTLESSILKSAVEDYEFVNLTSIVTNEATKLRNDGADIVVLLTHEGLNDFSMSSTYSEYYPIINNNVVDLIFSGHRHTPHQELFNGIPVLQTSANGSQVMQASFNVKQGEVNLKSYSLIDKETIVKSKSSQSFQQIYDKYEDEISSVKNEVLGTLDYSLYKTNKELLNLTNTAMLSYASSASYNTDVVVYNNAGVRQNLSAGNITFGDIYATYPFDNQLMFIREVSYQDLSYYINSTFYTSLFKNRAKLSDFSSDKKFSVLSIDYVTTGGYGNFNRYEQEPLNAIYSREVVANYIRQQKTIIKSDYSF